MPNQTYSSLSCCVCGRTESAHWRTSSDNLLGGAATYHAVRCRRCGTRRLDPRPPADEMARFYAPQTYARAEESGSEVGHRLEAYNAGIADRLSSLLPHPSSLLDVGCGDGRFLAAMASRGWQVTGTETDPAAAALARRRAAAVVHEAPLETLDLPDESFDAVSLLHVLEHVPDPRETLTQCLRLLRPGGVLLLALPNAASVESSLFGSAWYHLDLPRHLWGFTPHSLTRLVEETGFRVKSVSYFPLLFAPQSALTAARHLRQRGQASAASGGGSSSPRGRGGRLQTRVFLSLMAISERLGRTFPGEIMEMFAVKPGTRDEG